MHVEAKLVEAIELRLLPMLLSALFLDQVDSVDTHGLPVELLL